MSSIAFLINVIMIGLVVCVAIPAIVAVVAMRSRELTNSTQNAAGVSSQGVAKASADRTTWGTRKVAQAREHREYSVSTRPIDYARNPALQARRSTVHARRRTSISMRQSTSSARTSSSRTSSARRRSAHRPSYVTSAGSYVTSNGLTLTPNLHSVATLVSAPRSSHPHAEYWRYGNQRFYAHV